MSKQDALQLVENALDLTLQRATALIGPEVHEFIPVMRQGLVLLVKLIRDRGHHDTRILLDQLAAMPPVRL